MTVEELNDREELRRFLMTDRLAAAYLLGNLDPAYFQWCRVLGTRNKENQLSSLVMIYKGLSLPAIFTYGNVDDVCQIINERPELFPERFQFYGETTALNQFNHHFKINETREMIRMGLQKNDFLQVQCDTSYVYQLTHADIADIFDLYQYYSDHLFDPYQLETGYYYGVKLEGHQLVSIAGIHVFSQENDISLIGNFVTNPNHRSHGYATACTSALMNALLKKVSFVALNVPVGNEPALNLFKKFGFQENNLFTESVIETLLF